MLQKINQERRDKIRDDRRSIEFLHSRRTGLVAQREVRVPTYELRS